MAGRVAAIVGGSGQLGRVVVEQFRRQARPASFASRGVQSALLTPRVTPRVTPSLRQEHFKSSLCAAAGEKRHEFRPKTSQAWHVVNLDLRPNDVRRTQTALQRATARGCGGGAAALAHPRA